MSDTVMPQIAQAIKRLTGLHIEPEKYYLFEHRFPEVMREFAIADFATLLLEIQKGINLEFIGRIIEKITTHETRFFRDESIFDALAEQIIPEWKERSAIAGDTIDYPPLKIWSAACSTGQEVYSIAMMLAEMHPQLVKKTQILATDISAESVERAANGVYTEFEISRGLPDKFRNRYFVKTQGGGAVNKGALPAMEFRAMNLLQEPFRETFDIVFCRNVAYYFAADTRIELFRKMRSAVKKNGVLILGSAESLDGSLSDYVLREFGLARYYEVNNENVTIFARRRD
jgi:chemotaxis protein methyltransferase CheR